MPGPLAGVRVLDLGISIQGPWAATLLGFLGADVVKIERGSDRLMQERPAQNGLATTHTIANLNKRIAWLNLKDPANAPVRERLIEQADIVLDNMKVGAVNRLGLGPADILARNPRAISASSPGWGESGPMAGWTAIDSHVQMFSGFASLSGAPGGDPEFVRYPHLDISGASYFAAALVLGLIARDRAGAGFRLTTSHLAAAINLQISRLAEVFATGQPIPILGGGCVATVPHQYFRCRDLVWLAVGVETESQWQGLCRALGRDDLAANPRFATNRDRVAHRDLLVPQLEAVFATFPARWWAIQLERERVPVGYLQDFERLRFHQQIVENELILTVHHPTQGDLFAGNVPWRFSHTSAAVQRVAPVSGAATSTVQERGFDESDDPSPRHPSAEGETSLLESLPLAGMRIVESAQGYSGPMVGLLLAEAGAEVVKVEPPGGDYARQFAPALPDRESALFAALNRNKRSVVLDLDRPADQGRFRALIADADVVIEDWGPGVADRRGLSFEGVVAVQPSLVWLAISPFGERGPLRDHPGAELVLQAWSEFWQGVGTPGDAPARIGADLAGIGTGVMAFLGVLAAIYHRLQTGAGQRVAVSQLATMICLRSAQWAAISNPDRWEGDTFCNNQVAGPKVGYRTKDRPIYPTFNNGSETQFIEIVSELGLLDEALTDPRFGGGGRQSIGLGTNARALRPVWEQAFADRPAAALVQLFNDHGGAAVEMRYAHDIFDHPQAHALGILDQSTGPPVLRAPWRAPWGLPAVLPAPALDADRDRILGALAVQ